jgi:hypothetical protein
LWSLAWDRSSHKQISTPAVWRITTLVEAQEPTTTSALSLFVQNRYNLRSFGRCAHFRSFLFRSVCWAAHFVDLLAALDHIAAFTSVI